MAAGSELLNFTLSTGGQPGDAPGLNTNIHVERRDSAAAVWKPGSAVVGLAGADGAVGYSMYGVWSGNEALVWFTSDSTGASYGGRYTPATDTWKPMAKAGGPFCQNQACGQAYWGGGRMYVAGAQYDVATDTWSPAGGLPTNPALGAATVHGDLFGLGKAPVGSSFEVGAYVYDPVAKKWTLKATVGAPLWSDTITRVFYGVTANQELIVGADIDMLPGEVSAYRYDSTADRWSPVSYRPAWLTFPGGTPNAELVETGDKLLYAIDTTHVYLLDPVSGIWGIAPPVPLTNPYQPWVAAIGSMCGVLAGACSSGTAYVTGLGGSGMVSTHVFAFTPPTGPLALHCN